ncbi:hypothetical protein HV336_08225 [Citrobacter freundii]|uniref:hypothetical protein n=1 Tax=Citrobacter freundii TaxID=546 RepID=UPI0015E99005|nr:hypothetical protein [Citrobacter freundii]MDN4342494.1 hypothetical protein [Citrobacter freundii]QLR76880.1 hypothetical protein HV336_08225 [Citrobacter freundii]
MTYEQIAARLSIGPATVGDLVRNGANEGQIADLVRAGIAVVLQFSEDNDATIIGGYPTPAP